MTQDYLRLNRIPKVKRMRRLLISLLASVVLAVVMHAVPYYWFDEFRYAVLDGQTLVRELAKVPAYRIIPIVILTAKDLSQDERRSLGTAVGKVMQEPDIQKKFDALTATPLGNSPEEFTAEVKADGKNTFDFEVN